MSPAELNAWTLPAVWMLTDARLTPNALLLALAIVRLSFAEGLAAAVADRDTLALVSGVSPQHYAASAGELRGAGILFVDNERAHTKRHALLLVRERWTRRVGDFEGPLPNRSGLGPQALAAHVAESANAQRRTDQPAFIFMPPSVPDPAEALHPPTQDGRRAAAVVSARAPARAVPRQATPAASSSVTVSRPNLSREEIARRCRQSLTQADQAGRVVHSAPPNRPDYGRNSGDAHKIAHNPGDNSGVGEKSPKNWAISAGPRSPYTRGARPSVPVPVPVLTANSALFPVPVSETGKQETEGGWPGGTGFGTAATGELAAEILAELVGAVGPKVIDGAERYWREAIAWCPRAAREAAAQAKLTHIRKHAGGFLSRVFLNECVRMGRPAPSHIRDWWRRKGGGGR